MNPVLTLDHVSYSYHTPSGETPALKDVSFSGPARQLHLDCRSFRLRKIHTAFLNCRINRTRKGLYPLL